MSCPDGGRCAPRRRASGETLVRARVSQRRPVRCRARGFRSTRAAARCRTRKRACATRAGAAARRLLRRLDQAGPTGVIGTNKKDATETVEALLKDAEAGLIGGTEVSAEAVEALLAERGVGAVIYSGWEAIDAVERSAGEPQGRPSVKLTSWTTCLPQPAGRNRQSAPVGCIGTEL